MIARALLETWTLWRETFGNWATYSAKKGFRLAYENWCWATHAPDWKDVWEIVKRVNLDNVGLCLDTFQSAGGEWADPRTSSGLIEGPVMGRDDVELRWKASLKGMVHAIPGDKIYILQISDAYRMNPPLRDEKDKDGLRPRGQWSHDYRPLPYDGGYLPVEDFTKAILKTGFRGYMSMEVFDRKAPQKVHRRYDSLCEASHEQFAEVAGSLLRHCLNQDLLEFLGPR